MSLESSLIHAMEELNEEQVLAITRSMISAGSSSHDIQMCLNEGVSLVGKRFEAGGYFIADLIVSGMIYRSALDLLIPGTEVVPDSTRGVVLIGVAEGDIHDIGKDIIVSLLQGERFRVIDLGTNVASETFVNAIRTYQPDVLLLSGVLTATIDSMESTIQAIREAGLRDQVSILIGGMCANEFCRKKLGADGWAYDSSDTLAFCKKVVERKYEKA